MPRRKPFSNKQKKQQLQQKRQRKKDKGSFGASIPEKKVDQDPDHTVSSSSGDEDIDAQDGADGDQQDDGVSPVAEGKTREGQPQGERGSGGVVGRTQERPAIDMLNQQPSARIVASKGGVTGGHGGGGRYDPNRYHLHFESESKEEIERRKRTAKTVPIVPLPESSLEVSVDDVYVPGTVLDIPKRPPWSYSMTKEQVERQEDAMFQDYLQKIYSQHKPEKLSYFEHNLETWRQLWRVLEISDVVLLITDIRHPALHFSPALYDYVVKDLKKAIVLVLNKVDLVPPQVAVAWRHYFLSRFPQLSIVCFTSYPDQYASTDTNKKVRLKFKRGGRGRLPSAVGPRELFQVIEAMYRGKVDLDGWKERLATEQATPTNLTADDNVSSEDSDSDGEEPVATETSTMESSPLVSDDIREGILTIGMVGHPNVGKSSLINGLMGKKLVSTSRTPGHTKHFQTIFLTRSIRLCDCPGLVFPSLVNKQLQVLTGTYPIAQVREPYSAVGYLAERVPLVRLLWLDHPEGVAKEYKRTAGRRLGDCDLKVDDLDPRLARMNLKDANHEAMLRRIEEEREWTPWSICDAWAEKRHYYTSRAARTDTYRAANSLLRLAVDGRICLYFRPPGYSKEKGNWEVHPEVSDMIELQKRGMTSSSSPSRGLKSKGAEIVAGGEVKDHTDSASGARVAAAQTNVIGNKFELLMGCSDDGD